MKARASQTEATTEEAQRLLALPEKAEVHLTLPENLEAEAELFDRLMGQQIVLLFESDANNTRKGF